MRCDQYSLSRYRKPANFPWKLHFLHSHSTNISRITNVKAGGEGAAKTAQSTYWSCYNMIRTQILNWSQSCRNHKVGIAVRFQPSQNGTLSCPVRVPTSQDNVCRVFGRVSNQAKPIFQSKPGLLVGYPDPLLTLCLRMSSVLEMCWPDSIQFQNTVTIHRYQPVHYNSHRSTTHDPLWPELRLQAVHYEYLPKMKGFNFERFNQPHIITVCSPRIHVWQETWNYDVNLISRQKEHSSTRVARF